MNKNKALQRVQPMKGHQGESHMVYVDEYWYALLGGSTVYRVQVYKFEGHLTFLKVYPDGAGMPKMKRYLHGKLTFIQKC